MDNTIDIRELLEQTRDDAETTYKEGAARTVELGELITAIGWAVEAYIQLVYISERHLPDLDKKARRHAGDFRYINGRRRA